MTKQINLLQTHGQSKIRRGFERFEIFDAEYSMLYEKVKKNFAEFEGTFRSVRENISALDDRMRWKYGHLIRRKTTPEKKDNKPTKAGTKREEAKQQKIEVHAEEITNNFLNGKSAESQHNEKAAKFEAEESRVPTMGQAEARKLKEKRKERVRIAFMDGEHVNVISRNEGLTPEYIRRICTGLTRTEKKPDPLIEERNKQIIDAYRSGEDVEMIAFRHKVMIRFIRTLCRNVERKIRKEE